MTRTQVRGRSLIGLLVTLSLVAVSCGGDDDDADSAATGAPSDATVASEEAEAGDSTVATDAPAATDAPTATGAPAATDAPAASEAPSETTAAEKDDITLTMGGSSSSSSVFAFITAQSRIASESDGAMSINIRETGASSENIQLLRDGAVNFGLSGLSTIIEAQRGIGAFEGNAYPEICNLMVYLKNAEFITVRDDANIETVLDLDGKPFAPSFQGSALYDNILAYLAVLGVSPEVFDGGLEDIVNAMKDGRIVGFGKSGNGLGADASMLDVASAVDVHAIGYSQEQIDQILADAPENEILYQFIEIPPGSVYDNEEAFLTSVVIASYFADTSTMDEETQYRLTKSMFEALEQAATETNYAGAMGITAQDSLDTGEKLALCPGSQRYFDEVG